MAPDGHYRALVSEQLQPLVFGHHRPVVALAAADLRVAVDPDDEHATESDHGR